MEKLFLISILAFGVGASVFAGELVVKDVKGQTLTIDLVSVTGTTVTFTRKGETQPYTLPIERFDTASQATIKTVGAALPAPLPKLDVDVTVSKRHDKSGDWIVTQDVKASFKARNTSLTLSLPKVDARIVYFGQNREHTGLWIVLGKGHIEFDLKENATSPSQDFAGVSTRYDNDVKGSASNIGGYQYKSYLLVITTKDGKVVAVKTTNQALEKECADPEYAKKVVSMPRWLRLDSKLRPRKTNSAE